MFRKVFVFSTAATIAFSAFAGDPFTIEKSIELKDGSTVHIFKDGKMGMENKFGKVVSMNDGDIMEASSGVKIAMDGNETERLRMMLRPQYQY